MPNIRPIEEADREAAWRLIEPVFRAGEPYPHARDIGPGKARRVWVEGQSLVSGDGFAPVEAEIDKFSRTRAK